MQVSKAALTYTSAPRAANTPTPSEPPAPPPDTPPKDEKGPIQEWFDALPKWPRAAVYGLGSLTPAVLGGLAGTSAAGLPGTLGGVLAGGAVTFGFQKGIGADNREALYKSVLGTFAGFLFGGLSSVGLTPLTAGLAVALGAVGGMYAQMRQDLGQ